MSSVNVTYNARICQLNIPSGKVNVSVDSCSTRRNCIAYSHHDIPHHMRTIYNRQPIYAVIVGKRFVITSDRFFNIYNIGRPAVFKSIVINPVDLFQVYISTIHLAECIFQAICIISKNLNKNIS